MMMTKHIVTVVLYNILYKLSFFIISHSIQYQSVRVKVTSVYPAMVAYPAVTFAEPHFG